ncbi:ABHD12 [Mytilus coruscus]|uniref:ABHD12 n=1 Tax=Mytilus coruscus TaxID=42192 RepID=A0A6J8AAH2_MYTCO|nr:ABHD12 [Mytilus coruscus]
MITLQTGVGQKLQKVMSNVRQRKSVNSEAKENKAKEQKNGSPKITKKETENKGFYRHILKRFLKHICGLLFFLYVVIPVFVKTNPWIHSKMVFLNMVRWPPFIDLTKPWEFGLRGARNFYLDVNEESRIGVWQILPNSSVEEGGDFDKLLGNGKTVILYLHGTTGTRGGWHRVQLLKLLASLDFHVVAFDYRGYGDSKGHPTEDGVVEDGYFMYKWIKERSKDSTVILWGHSLGTAITTKLARLLCLKNEDPDGVVLESPFNNIRDAAIRHPFTAVSIQSPFNNIRDAAIRHPFTAVSIQSPFNNIRDAAIRHPFTAVSIQSPFNNIRDAAIRHPFTAVSIQSPFNNIRDAAIRHPFTAVSIQSPFNNIRDAAIRHPFTAVNAAIRHPFTAVSIQSPFNNIRDAAIRHPFTALFRFMPMFKEIFIDTIAENGIYFSSDENIAQVTSPLMMIHAEDDEIVPYELGRKLYEAAEKTRTTGSASIEFIPFYVMCVNLYEAAEKTRTTGSASIEFISFNASEGLGHKHIFKALEIPNIIKNFIHETCQK